jgi:DNA-binding GntR family transcriptional regulator
VSITGHQRLIDQYHLLEQQVRHYIVCSNALIMDLKQIVSEHEPIVQAIIAGNAEAAETLARQHNAPEVERAAAAMAREQAEQAAEPQPAKRKSKAPARQSKAA